ncbi:hypothetical protein PBY51_011075 [Eleginops maclovinus]|uniref:Uncharacterized protein n=1 Tax=Eleginops maclovinus TaxID=56733 RepID=A0AAN8ACP8_ELEMC|nr:hypothetical protein PBY51_011075 [Eleginops maclovinus]
MWTDEGEPGVGNFTETKSAAIDRRLPRAQRKRQVMNGESAGEGGLGETKDASRRKRRRKKRCKQMEKLSRTRSPGID